MRLDIFPPALSSLHQLAANQAQTTCLAPDSSELSASFLGHPMVGKATPHPSTTNLYPLKNRNQISERVEQYVEDESLPVKEPG